MQEIISTPMNEYESDNYTNEITDLMNLCLKTPYKKHFKQGYSFGTYMQFRLKSGASIRFPGATRGHVEWDENFVITKFVIYEHKDFDYKIDVVYKKELWKRIEKYVGAKMIIPEGVVLRNE